MDTRKPESRFRRLSAAGIFFQGGAAAVEGVNRHFSELLVGQTMDTVDDIASAWDRLYDASLPYGRKGIAVMALSGVDLDKSRFRATLIMVWFTLNGLLTLGYAAQGALQPVWPQLAALAPVVLAGIVLGEILHHRVDEHRFRQVLFSVLLLAGLALVF